MSLNDANSLTTRTVTRERAREAGLTDDQFAAQGRPAWIIAMEEIAQQHGVTLDVLRGKHKFQKLCRARLACYRYLRERGWTTPRIGKFFGRDHSTIVLALASEEARAGRKERQLESRQRRMIRAVGL